MEAMKEDMKEYMQKTFQIKLEEASMSGTKPVNILEILDTMIVPNVEASVAANGVRENALACKDINDQTEDTQGRKRRSACTCSCKNATYKLSGNNCFGGSDHSLNFTEAVDACSALGAQLSTNSTIDSSEDDNFVTGLMAPDTASDQG